MTAVGQTLIPSVPGLRESVEALQKSIVEQVGSNLIGLYLDGSIALSAFDKTSHYVNFVALLREELNSRRQRGLALEHLRLRAEFGLWASRTEGIYLPQFSLSRNAPVRQRHHVLSAEGGFHRSQLRSDWPERANTVLATPIVLAGETLPT